ncbi:MAG: hypothetical protein QOH62_1379 [Solirubrobacteraceae bacterium]|nr:hypothetical protein [Solirubrobacteraceae bacterium]
MLRAGRTPRELAESLGVSEQTLRNWRRAMFHRVWIEGIALVAVEPRHEFFPYLQRATTRLEKRERRDSNPRPPA